MNAEKRLQSDAVSESLGFLLIFTIVIVGIGLVTLYGYPILLQQQTSSDEQIMEKNMIVLQNDVKSLSYKTIPYTETSLKIGSGTLTAYNTSASPPSPVPPSSTIDIYDNSGAHSLGSGNEFVSSYHSGELRYESVSADRVISLQNGAVVARNLIENGSTMLADPRWFYDSPTKTTVINLIAINSTEPISRGGIGDVQMKLGELAATDFISYPGLTGDIFVQYTPDPNQDYSVAWSNYFTSLNPTMINPCINSPGYMTCKLPPTTTLVVKRFDVTVDSV